MRQLTPESVSKLQRILSKRVGRELTDEELEEAYYALIGFAVALVELDSNETNINPPAKKSKQVTTALKYPIANTNSNVLHYV